jgi:TRAP-type C4-dicarboxylate transport system permease small subunit
MASGAAAALERSAWLLDRAASVVATLLLLAMAGLNGLEAVSRLFGASSIYYVQVSLACSTLVYFVGYLILLRRGEDVSVGFFHALMPRPAQKLVDCLTALAIVVFFAVLLHASLDYYALTSLMRHPVLPVQQSVTAIPIILGAAGCLWVALYKAVTAIRALGSRDER